MLWYFYTYIEPSLFASHIKRDCFYSHFTFEESIIQKILQHFLVEQKNLNPIFSDPVPKHHIKFRLFGFFRWKHGIVQIVPNFCVPRVTFRAHLYGRVSRPSGKMGSLFKYYNGCHSHDKSNLCWVATSRVKFLKKLENLSFLENFLDSLKSSFMWALRWEDLLIRLRITLKCLLFSSCFYGIYTWLFGYYFFHKKLILIE